MAVKQRAVAISHQCPKLNRKNRRWWVRPLSVQHRSPRRPLSKAKTTLWRQARQITRIRATAFCHLRLQQRRVKIKRIIPKENSVNLNLCKLKLCAILTHFMMQARQRWFEIHVLVFDAFQIMRQLTSPFYFKHAKIFLFVTVMTKIAGVTT